jgi:hypothetical protein
MKDQDQHDTTLADTGSNTPPPPPEERAETPPPRPRVSPAFMEALRNAMEKAGW